MLTEEEAKTKWCPFVQVSQAAAENGYARESNRPSSHSMEVGAGECEKLCLGSVCMAWRKDPSIHEYSTSEEVPDGHGWVETEIREDVPLGGGVFALASRNAWRRVNGAERGYCGLAGKP